jgi:hypothetical protein
MANTQFVVNAYRYDPYRISSSAFVGMERLSRSHKISLLNNHGGSDTSRRRRSEQRKAHAERVGSSSRLHSSAALHTISNSKSGQSSYGMSKVMLHFAEELSQKDIIIELLNEQG